MFARLLAALFLLTASPLRAEEPAETKHLPGVALAQGITEITGVAISPLLGVSSVGAWRYFKAPAEVRAELPWFCQPWAWGTGFVVLSLCFLKDSVGAAAPGLLKKPFDMAELFEDKASALVASAAFVPLVAGEMAEALKTESAAPAAAIGLAAAAPVDFLWLLVPLSVFAFLSVWLCSHAINVLIVLSPFSTVDTVLKLLRSSLLAMVAISWFVAPWLAAVFCLLILAVAVWLAPAALRLAIFGARFAADILLPRRGRRRATPERPHVFTLGRFDGLPARTGGRLALAGNGRAVFLYRPWCVLPEKSVAVPDGFLHVSKGLLSPGLTHRPAGETRGIEIFVFLPRYRGHEENVVRELRLAGTRDHAFSRGLTTVRGWLRGMLRRRDALP